MGIRVNIDGYIVSSEFYKQAISINLLNDHPALNKETAVVLIHGTGKAKPDASLNLLAEKYSNRPNVRFVSVTDEPFWKELNVYHQKSDELFLTNAGIHPFEYRPGLDVEIPLEFRK